MIQLKIIDETKNDQLTGDNDPLKIIDETKIDQVTGDNDSAQDY